MLKSRCGTGIRVDDAAADPALLVGVITVVMPLQLICRYEISGSIDQVAPRWNSPRAVTTRHRGRRGAVAVREHVGHRHGDEVAVRHDLLTTWPSETPEYPIAFLEKTPAAGCCRRRRPFRPNFRPPSIADPRDVDRGTVEQALLPHVMPDAGEVSDGPALLDVDRPRRCPAHACRGPGSFRRRTRRWPRGSRPRSGR